MDNKQFDAFSTLKALRRMKKDLEERKKVINDKQINQRSQSNAQKKRSQQSIKTSFQILLTKLLDNDIKEQILKDIKNFILEQRANDSLGILLLVVSGPQIYQEDDGLLKVIGMIIEIYNDRIQIQELYKLLEVVMKHFKFSSTQVQYQCTQVWSIAYCQFVQKLNLNQKSLLFYQTLAGIICGGANLLEQDTSLQVMQKLYEMAGQQKDLLFIKDSLKTFFTIYFRPKLWHASVFLSLEAILNQISIDQFQNQQISIIDKCLEIYSDQKTTYKIRLAAGNVLKLIGQQYLQNKILLKDFYFDQVAQILLDQTRDRLIPIQNSARAALKEWNKLQNYEQQEMKKITTGKDQDYYQVTENFNELKEKELIVPSFKENYIRKNTGIGGGQVNIPQINKIQSTQNQLKQIKNTVQHIQDPTENQNEQEIDDLTFSNLEKTQYFAPENNLEITKDFNQQYKEQQSPQFKQYFKSPFSNINFWDTALNMISKNQNDDAIEFLLDEGDDLYILKVLLMQKDLQQFLANLNKNIRKRLINQITLISKSDFLNVLCLDFLQDFIDSSVGDMINDKEMIEYLTYLEKSQSQLNQQAQYILNQLQFLSENK